MADTPANVDIFGNKYAWGGSWKLDGAVILIDADNEANQSKLICNSCTINYARPVNKIIPLNTSNQFLVAGRGAGTLSLGMIVAPSNDLATFMNKYSDPCKVDKNTITVSGTGQYCPAGTTSPTGNVLKFICRYCLLQSVNTAVQAGDIAIVSAGLTLVIGQLSIPTSTTT